MIVNYSKIYGYSSHQRSTASSASLALQHYPLKASSRSSITAISFSSSENCKAPIRSLTCSTDFAPGMGIAPAHSNQGVYFSFHQQKFAHGCAASAMNILIQPEYPGISLEGISEQHRMQATH